MADETVRNETESHNRHSLHAVVRTSLMNKNTKQRKAQTEGKWQPRKSTRPKVAASADAIMRRLQTGKYAHSSGYLS